MPKILTLISFVFMLSIQSANATVVLDNFNISSTNLSFDAYGTVTTKGTSHTQQLMMGLVDSNADWIASFNSGASSWTYGAQNAVSVSSVYDLTSQWTDSLLTVGTRNYNIGEIIDISFNFVGVFNLANFNVNNFGLQVGSNTHSNLPTASLNLVVSSINGPAPVPAPVPAPATLALMGLGLLGFRLSHNREKA